MARELAILGVFPDPADVGPQRLTELISALLELRWIVEEDEVQPPQRLGYRCVLDAQADDRRQTLVKRGRVLDFAQRLPRGDGIGREHEHDRVGLLDPDVFRARFEPKDERLKLAG